MQNFDLLLVILFLTLVPQIACFTIRSVRNLGTAVARRVNLERLELRMVSGRRQVADGSAFGEWYEAVLSSIESAEGVPLTPISIDQRFRGYTDEEGCQEEHVKAKLGNTSTGGEGKDKDKDTDAGPDVRKNFVSGSMGPAGREVQVKFTSEAFESPSIAYMRLVSFSGPGYDVFNFVALPRLPLPQSTESIESRNKNDKDEKKWTGDNTNDKNDEKKGGKEEKEVLPVLGIDVVVLPGGALAAIDLQPSRSMDEKTSFADSAMYQPLREHLHAHPHALPPGGALPAAAQKYFSPYVLWTRLPPPAVSASSDEGGSDGRAGGMSEVRAALEGYLKSYGDSIRLLKADANSHALGVAAEKLEKGERGGKGEIRERNGEREREFLLGYLSYRAKNDPAAGMLKGAFGPAWTEEVLEAVMFPKTHYLSPESGFKSESELAYPEVKDVDMDKREGKAVFFSSFEKGVFEPKQGEEEEASEVNVSSAWVKDIHHKSGAPYWFNPITGESTWFKPKDLIEYEEAEVEVEAKVEDDISSLTTEVEQAPRVVHFATGNEKKRIEVEQLLQQAGVSGVKVVAAKLDLVEQQGSCAVNICVEKARCAAELMKREAVFVEDTSLCFNALGGLPGVYVKWFLSEIGRDGLVNLLAAYDDKSAYAQTVISFYDPLSTLPLSDGSDGLPRVDVAFPGEGDNDHSDDKDHKEHKEHKGRIITMVGRTNGKVVASRWRTPKEGGGSAFGCAGGADGAFGWDPIFEPFSGTISDIDSDSDTGTDSGQPAQVKAGAEATLTYGEMILEEKNAVSHRSKAFTKLLEYMQQTALEKNNRVS